MWWVQKRKDNYLYCWQFNVTENRNEYKIFSLWDLDKFAVDVTYLDKSLTHKTGHFSKAQAVIISLLLYFRDGCNNPLCVVKKRLYHFKDLTKLNEDKIRVFEEKAKLYGFKLLERTNCD